MEQAPIVETMLRDFLLDTAANGQFELIEKSGMKIGLTKEPSHTFNWIFALEKISMQQLSEIKQYLQQFRKQNIPALFFVGSQAKSDALKNVLSEQGMHDPMHVECMSFPLEQFDIKNYDINSNIVVREITTDKEFNDWCEISAVAFDHDAAMAQKVLKPSFKKPNFHFFVTYKNEQPVGETVLYVKGDVAACHWGSVHPDFRKERIATTAVIKRLQKAKELGCKEVVVECFPASANLFKRIGFKVISAMDMYLIE